MAELSKGVEIRAQMDIEFGKALVLTNGAGIIALLTFLSSIFEVPRYASLARPAIGGVLLLVAGLLTALYYIRFSRECSLVYEQHGMRTPPGTLFGIQLTRPRSCTISAFMAHASCLAFCAAALLIAFSWWCLL
jgi:hypothetical protein